MNDVTGRPQNSLWRRARAPYAAVTVPRHLQPLPRTRFKIQPAITARSRFIDAISNPDFVATAIFCAIGLLGTVNSIWRIPGAGMM